MKNMVGSFLSSVYGFSVGVSQGFYRSVPTAIKKVPAHVVSIGNITWGGTGKTPLVAKLAKDLSAAGKKVVILTRGYGQDEVKELQKKLPNVPVIVGRDRIRTAREAVKKHKAEIILLDDGFQHIRLHRTVDVVNINTTMPFGPSGLIPKGTLREPLENLSRAHVFILTKSNIGSKNIPWIRQKLQALQPKALIFEAIHKPVQFMDFRRNRYVPLSEIKGKKVAALSAIGDPYSFEKTVEGLGTEIAFAARFDDHHAFTESELTDFAKRVKDMGGIKDVITTEKDFYRMEPLLRRKRNHDLHALNFLVLQIEFQMDDEEDFLRICGAPEVPAAQTQDASA